MEKLNQEMKDLKEKMNVLWNKIQTEDMCRDSFRISSRQRTAKKDYQECIKRKQEIEKIIKEMENNHLNPDTH